MAEPGELGEWLLEYEALSEQMAPLLARYATGGTNTDRKAMLLSQLHDEYRQHLLAGKDSRPSVARIEQFVHADERFLAFIEETEARREELFRLSAKRHAVLFKIRSGIRHGIPDSEDGASEDV